MTIHLSGICKMEKCDKPSVADGYCAFHYNIEKQKENSKLQSMMVNLLISMDDRLTNIEEKLADQQVVTREVVQKENTELPKDVEERISKPKRERISSVFVPSIGTPDGSANIKDVKTSQTKKDVRHLASQLRATSSEE